MNSYLVLIHNGSLRDHLETDEKKKFDHYKNWGRYLSQFSEDERFISGSAIGKNVHILTKKEEVNIDERTSLLEGYMILQAKNMEELKLLLKGIPGLEHEYSEVNIYPLDPKPV